MEKIQLRMILEILGRPASNVTNALTSLSQRLSTEKGLKIIEQTLHEPVPVKDSRDLFTTFGEFVLELDSMNLMFGIMFSYMPAHAEIISPEEMTIKNSDLSALLNALLQRLHNYDAIAKRLVVDNEFITKKLFDVAPHLFKKQGDRQVFEPEEQKSKKKANKIISKKKKKK